MFAAGRPSALDANALTVAPSLHPIRSRDFRFIPALMLSIQKCFLRLALILRPFSCLQSLI